ncbi:hypothetical protein [Halobacterium sp. CBA1126]|uniref:hypothetical protein n=1 Tax=Halobacterium sp. CBA1126 TaxID=2668074 RepID=UPI0012F8DE96|nr:hypothetical protein [Halobacterium sp. CBA1126]MUV59952.1 hypothetical protein [Halobacterium sp. CBA1126]
MADPSDEDLIEACPECDTAAVRARHPEKPSSRRNGSDARYRCSHCQARFDEPNFRPRKGNTGPGAGSALTAKLAKLDPEDVGGAD